MGLRFQGFCQVSLRLVLCCLPIVSWAECESAESKPKIVLVAGETALIDKMGHHDYLAGCRTIRLPTGSCHGKSTTAV